MAPAVEANRALIEPHQSLNRALVQVRVEASVAASAAEARIILIGP